MCLFTYYDRIIGCQEYLAVTTTMHILNKGIHARARSLYLICVYGFVLEQHAFLCCGIKNWSDFLKIMSVEINKYIYIYTLPYI